MRAFRDKDDPSRAWVEDPNLRIALDLGRPAFCDVPFGGRLQGLSGLGPADRWRSSHLTWSGKGIVIGVADAGALHRCDVLYRRASWDRQHGFKGYAGTCCWFGDPLLLGPNTTEVEVLDRLGEPYWRADVRADDYSLFYEFERYELQFAFANWMPAPWLLEKVRVLLDPYLASERARTWEGVTKPWPPVYR
ncbi:MAG: hypothetical protein JXO22_07055 [Phycisphaerae bacterium]|nr:hypothetical protein [Phycisphaerae bacterium]